MIRAYDVRFSEARATMTNRTSYVIAPNGRIIYVYSRPRLAQPRHQHAGRGPAMADPATAAVTARTIQWAIAAVFFLIGWRRAEA